MEVQGQELMTKDKVTLRVNLSVRYRVANAVKVIEELKDYHDLFYRMVQMALREAVSAKTRGTVRKQERNLPRDKFRVV